MPYAHQDQVGRGEHYCPNVCDLFRVLSRADRSCIRCQKVLGGFLLVRVSLCLVPSVVVANGIFRDSLYGCVAQKNYVVFDQQATRNANLNV